MQKVFVIGSGPIVIGQAAEFDYSGTQAIKALKEEGCQVVLLNSNPATIMTDLDLVDTLYSEPMTLSSAVAIIEKERPDAIVLGMGGQTSLNLGMQLYKNGTLDRYDIRVLGTHPIHIERAEDRELFKNEMLAIGEPVMPSASVTSIGEALLAADQIGYPVIVRPAFTLGGFGGGICQDQAQLISIATEGLKKSPVTQVLIEKSVYGWKEIEYEMMRDNAGNAIAVCNMENMDPVGIHTGDSIVVAPSQTLNDQQYQMLRQASIRIVNRLEIIGGCNVQFALSPYDNQYYIIEVNPRVSRSSALASKATGYAIAKIAMRLGLGQTLDTIQNQVTQKTMACHEPTLDYCVVKMPRWPYDKLKSDSTNLGTVMRATGEVMAIGTRFEEALLKAIRSLDLPQHDLYDPAMANLTLDQLYSLCQNMAYNRVFALAELIRRNQPLATIHDHTAINLYFLNRLTSCVNIEKRLRGVGHITELPPLELANMKQWGFSNQSLATLTQTPIQAVTQHLEALCIKPAFRMVDTCGGEFDAHSNYLYSTYNGSNESVRSDKKKIVVVGSGPIRIGQGVEFDYSSVKALMAIRKLGYEAIMINNNPETVSTDYDLSDKLYFEPLTYEDVLAIIRHEKPYGVMLQFGGQTAIKLAGTLEAAGVNLLGIDAHCIDRVEDRDLFYTMLDQEGILRARGRVVSHVQEALDFAQEVGYPVLLRPSYVIGGQDMKILRQARGIEDYFAEMELKYGQRPILVDQYLDGVELEIDILSDGESVFIPGFMEHLDQAGVHSGDSIALYPARIGKNHMVQIYQIAEKIARSLQYKGVMNMQLVKAANQIYVLEVNPRASRSLPFIAKVTKTPMIQWAVSLSLGANFTEIGIVAGMMRPMAYAAVKSPVFSNEKLVGIDSLLGPNMLSTGESMFLAPTLEEALDKCLVADGIQLHNVRFLLDLTGDDLNRYTELSKKFRVDHQGSVITSSWVYDDKDFDVLVENFKQEIDKKQVNVVLATRDFSEGWSKTGAALRRAAVEKGLVLVTSPDKQELIWSHLERGHRDLKIFAHSTASYIAPLS